MAVKLDWNSIAYKNFFAELNDGTLTPLRNYPINPVYTCDFGVIHIKWNFDGTFAYVDWLNREVPFRYKIHKLKMLKCKIEKREIIHHSQ